MAQCNTNMPSVSQGRIYRDNLTCCHTEIQAVDQTCYLTRIQYTATLEAVLSKLWFYSVSAMTGWPGISILWLDEAASLIHNIYHSVAVRTAVKNNTRNRSASILPPSLSLSPPLSLSLSLSHTHTHTHTLTDEQTNIISHSSLPFSSAVW